jgi:hypothetical protein
MSSCPDQSDAVGRLRIWLEQQGAKFGSICCMMDEAGLRGIFATDNIEKNEMLLSVPSKLLMGKRSALRDKDIVSAERNLHATDEVILAVHLLNECSKGIQSFWYPYICTLPRSYSTGYSLREADIDSLQLPYAQRTLFEHKAKADVLFESASEIMKALNIRNTKWASKKAFLWALSSLSSRTMYFPDDTVGVLCPYGDLHNYRSPPGPLTPHSSMHDTFNSPSNADISGDGLFDEEEEVYNIVARTRYSKGSQVYLCYGRHTNLHLLQYYGFCLQDNPHDTALIPIDYFMPVVSQHLSQQEDVYIHHDGSPSFQLIRALRMASMDSDSRKKYAFKVLNDEPVDAKSERDALSLLREAILKAQQQSYYTPLSRDIVQLQNEDNECLRVAIEWRIGYKSILERCLNKISTFGGESPEQVL